jgi:hypothetical protein
MHCEWVSAQILHVWMKLALLLVVYIHSQVILSSITSIVLQREHYVLEKDDGLMWYMFN